MSATEKLKALAARDDWPYPDGPDDPQAPLLRALPQIMAVVEAAERQATLDDECRRGPMIRRELQPALAALDKALT